MNSYKFQGRKGIDDLKSLFVFHSSSQGDHYATNSLKEYEESEGWLNFDNSCELTEDSITKEIESRIEANKAYIEKLYAEGTFGKAYEFSIDLVSNPLFDTPSIIKDTPLVSYKMIWLDNNKDK